MKQVAIYCRQSKDRKDSLSIETQIEKCQALCSIKGKPYQVYSDKGFSGSNTDRPAYSLMLNDIKKGLIDEVVVYKLDRISRNLNDFTNMVFEFQKYDVTVASAVESFDNSTPMGRAMINLLMVFAQLEREQTADRIKDNVMYRATQGRWTGGTVPYGYDAVRVQDGAKTKPMLIPNEEESKIVIDIFNWYLNEDMPLRAIAHKLNFLGIQTKNDKKWSASRITLLLKSLYYCKNGPLIHEYFDGSKYILLNDLNDYNDKTGMNYYKKRISDKEQYVVVSEHQGIIDAETWISTQGKFGIKINRANTAKKNLLNGLVKCHYCGKSMNLHGNQYTYYKCKTREDFGTVSCIQSGIRGDKLENEIIKKILSYCSSESKVKKIISISKKPDELPKINNEFEMLNNNLKNKNNDIAKIISFLKTSDNPKVNFIVSQELEQLSNEIAEIESKINSIKLQKDTMTNKVINQELILELFMKFPESFKSADFDLRKKLIRQLVESVIVKGKEATITFKKF